MTSPLSGTLHISAAVLQQLPHELTEMVRLRLHSPPFLCTVSRFVPTKDGLCVLNLRQTSDYGQRGFHPLPCRPPYVLTHPLRIEITLKVYVHELRCSLSAHDDTAWTSASWFFNLHTSRQTDPGSPSTWRSTNC